MTATINTDASYNGGADGGYAGYAFWTVVDNKRYKEAGVFKQKVDDSTEAELCCIANALHHLIHVVKPAGLSKVYINTDSKSAMHFITNDLKESSKGKYKKVLSTIRVLLQELKQYEMRHVKGHSRTNTKRSYVNSWCDDESRKVLTAFIKTLWKR